MRFWTSIGMAFSTLSLPTTLSLTPPELRIPVKSRSANGKDCP